ncbi:MAG: TatD family hydrolase, partial [Pseudomonadales bacterium]
GLDFNRNFSSPEAQVEAFSRQLALASEVGKPLFLHERDAFDTQFAMLKKHRANFSEAVIHCFTGSHQDLRAYLSLGMYIGVTGWVCDERRGAQLQDAVKFIPDDKLLIETDTPYLTPRTLPNRLRKRKNEPANLGHIASTIAALRGQSVEHIREMTMSNSKRFFALN